MTASGSSKLSYCAAKQQEHEYHSEGEGNCCGVPCYLFLQRDLGPFETET